MIFKTKRKLKAAEAAIRFLRQTVKDLLKHDQYTHQIERCSCDFCSARYALAVTSGYEEEK